jgi:CshA-type fibril repeat protein
VFTPVSGSITIGNGTTVAVTVSNPFTLQTPAISLVKSVASVDVGADGVLGAGDEVTYAFTVTNTGNVALTGVTVTDGLATMSGSPISLAVGASNSVNFTATYVLTAADVTAGGVENTATATGTPPSGVDVSDVSDTGTGVDGDPVGTPESVETPSPLGGLPNDDTDPTDDPTTVRILPSAVDDEDLNNTIGDAVTVGVLANDSAGLVASTVQILTPGTRAPVTSLTVDGQGEWTVNAATGAVTFTPLSSFTGDPTPVEYRAANGFGDTVTATVTITYLAATPPPGISSRAYVDGVPNGKITAGPATIVDKVFYTNVIPNQNYRLRGELVYIESGVIVFTGITGAGSFTPTAADGTTEVMFALSDTDVEELNSKKLFIFLTLVNSANQDVAFDGATVASDSWFDTTEEWFTVASTIELAFTGAASVMALVAGALGAVAAGLLLLFVGRRRNLATRASASQREMPGR